MGILDNAQLEDLLNPGLDTDIPSNRVNPLKKVLINIFNNIPNIDLRSQFDHGLNIENKKVKNIIKHQKIQVLKEYSQALSTFLYIIYSKANKQILIMEYDHQYDKFFKYLKSYRDIRYKSCHITIPPIKHEKKVVLIDLFDNINPKPVSTIKLYEGGRFAVSKNLTIENTITVFSIIFSLFREIHLNR